MKRTHWTVGTLVLALALGGCDDILGTKREEAKAERDRAAERAADAEALQKSRTAMTQYAANLIGICEGAIPKAEKRLAEVTKDVDTLTAATTRIGSGQDSKGKELSPEVVLLRVLKDKDVNELARKYLKEDFSLPAGEFFERVRAARAEQARYEAALRQSEQVYDESINESRKWANASLEQREAEMKRLQTEIASYERKKDEIRKELRSTTRRSMNGSRHLEHDKAERRAVEVERFNDIDSEISKRRGQIDMLRNPNAQQQVASRAVDDAQRSQDRANSVRRQALDDIDRRLRPRKTVADVTGEYTRRTIQALREAIRGEATAAETRCTKLRTQVMELKKLAASVPVSDAGELKALKRKIDAL